LERRSQTLGYSRIINTVSKLEPMSKGPYVKKAAEVTAKAKIEQNELNHGYEHTGSPFDHPYLKWMDSLRKNRDTNLKRQATATTKSKEEVIYHKYLSEVKALNIVKDFLAENRD